MLSALKSSVFALHARNYLIVRDARHVICWTPRGEVTGGTGQAIRIANSLNIPVHNLGLPEKEEAFRKRLQEFKATKIA